MLPPRRRYYYDITTDHEANIIGNRYFDTPIEAIAAALVVCRRYDLSFDAEGGNSRQVPLPRSERTPYTQVRVNIRVYETPESVFTDEYEEPLGWLPTPPTG
jgi:hypothetical protein